jgi:DNA-binding MarR family transcriptional regulator
MSRGKGTDFSDRAELLGALNQAMRKSSARSVLLSQAVAERAGMSSADMECLDILINTGPVTAGELAELTGLTTGAVTGLIDRLEKGGYAQRERDPNDRRRVIVQPLPKVEQDIAPLYDGLLRVIDEVCSHYSEEQLALLLDFFNRLEPAFVQEIASIRGKETKEQTKNDAAMSGDFAAPLLSSSGRLIFGSFAFILSIKADPDLPTLYHAHFERPIPEVKALGAEGNVTIRYPRLAFLDWLRNWGKPRGEVTLNGSIPWSLEFRGPISRISADLARLELNAIELRDGVDETELTLPRPVGSVPIRFHNGINAVTIHRPAGVALRVQVHKSVTDLKIDQRSFDAISHHMDWETPNYKTATNRYDIEIMSGSNRVNIGTY